MEIIDIFRIVVKKALKILTFRIISIALLLTFASSNTFAVAQYLCSSKMEQTEKCCCSKSENTNDGENAVIIKTDCGCCITQGQPIDNSLPAVTISSNNLINDQQFITQSDIGIPDFYSSGHNILISHTPLITQDINILNANLRI